MEEVMHGRESCSQKVTRHLPATATEKMHIYILWKKGRAGPSAGAEAFEQYWLALTSCIDATMVTIPTHTNNHLWPEG